MLSSLQNLSKGDSWSHKQKWKQHNMNGYQNFILILNLDIQIYIQPLIHLRFIIFLLLIFQAWILKMPPPLLFLNFNTGFHNKPREFMLFHYKIHTNTRMTLIVGVSLPLQSPLLQWIFLQKMRKIIGSNFFFFYVLIPRSGFQFSLAIKT